MTEFAKEACRTAQNVLQVHCDQVVAGFVTLNDMRTIRQNKKTVMKLCTAASIKGFNLPTWLDRLDGVEKYIERVKLFHNLLHSDVQGITLSMVHYVHLS